jgi:flotillin
MKVSKRILACVLAGCMSASALVGCGGSESSKKPGSSDVDTSGVKSIYFLNFKPEIAEKYEAIAEAEAKKAQAEALRFAMEQEAEGIKAKGLAEALAIEKKAEAQKKMGEASVLEMYLAALPEIVKNAAEPLAKTDKIVMYGDGNSTKLMKDVMSSTNQIFEGVKEATGLDMQSMISGFVGGKAASDSNNLNK